MRFTWLMRLCLYGAIVFIVCISAALVFSSDGADPRRDRLLQRVNSYFESRLQDRTDLSYSYYDPFFRVRVSRRQYEGNLLDVKFNSYKIGDINITENIAKVHMEVEFEIPETIIFGKKISVPRKKDNWVDDWIWIDGDWFKVYKVNIYNSYIPLFPSFPP